MWTVKIISLIVIFLMLSVQNLLACTYKDSEKKMLSYPYIADEYRNKQITEGYDTIFIGMTCDEVRNILGNPDEIYKLYKSKTAVEEIGFTHWYILQRLQESGSVLEKGEHLVRISYDLNGVVIKKDRW